MFELIIIFNLNMSVQVIYVTFNVDEIKKTYLNTFIIHLYTFLHYNLYCRQ